MAGDARGIVIDDLLWPVVMLRGQDILEVPDMERYNEGLAQLLARKQPFACVLMVRKTAKMDRKCIGVHAAWLKANDPEIKKYWKGVAFVLPSEVQRFVLSTLLLAAPAATDYKVFTSVKDAGRWASSVLRAAGVTVPDLAPHMAREHEAYGA